MVDYGERRIYCINFREIKQERILYFDRMEMGARLRRYLARFLVPIAVANLDVFGARDTCGAIDLQKRVPAFSHRWRRRPFSETSTYIRAEPTRPRGKTRL